MAEGMLSRRGFLRVSALTTTAAAMAACGVATQAPEATQAPSAATPAPTAPGTSPAATTAPAASTGKYKEAPALAEMVAAGQLPPVDERLPLEPLVIEVVEEIGQYGGTWHRAAIGPNDTRMKDRLTNEGPVRWSADGASIIPNVAKSLEINENATEFTLTLREGMKWSDGQPLTADDILFWHEDVRLNEEITPSYPAYFRDPTSGEPPTVEKIDDYTVVIRFANPYGIFDQQLAGPYGLDLFRWPKHYLSQFHPKYADADELAQKVADANFDQWYQLFGDRAHELNPDCPRIWAWILTRVPPDIPVLAERNPYYWKVDPEGNQLPYIDSVQFEIVESADLVNLKALAGEIDMQLRHILWSNFPLFIEGADRGDFRVLQWTAAEGSNCLLYTMLNHNDPGLRALWENIDFRHALSLCIDRNAINELAYSGLGVPRQGALIPECPYFRQSQADAYAELDPDTANQLLDAVGLTERDPDGFRLRPDGTPLSIFIEYPPIFGPWRDVLQLVADQWTAVGVRAVTREEDRSLFEERINSGDPDCVVWTMDGCFTPLLGPWYSMPASHAYLYYEWYTSKGESGEEPPAEIKAQYELYDTILGSTPDQIEELAVQYFDQAAEQLWYIGTVGLLPHLVIVTNNFRNVPEAAISDYYQTSPGNTACEQYFIRQA